ncbi:MAG: hypothetical protein GY841_15595 [FCB group bacterium]|nr:hypothetical protein [FCB group bacterium]
MTDEGIIVKGENLTTDEIIEQLNKQDRDRKWYKVDDGVISWDTLEAKQVSSVQIVAGCRADNGGPLKCRECKRMVGRDEKEIHLIEDGWCNCKECYDKYMDMWGDDEDDDETTETVFKNCLRCGMRIEVSVENSCISQYCEHCLDYKSVYARMEKAEAFIANLNERK